MTGPGANQHQHQPRTDGRAAEQAHDAEQRAGTAMDAVALAARIRAALCCGRAGCPCRRPGPEGNTHCPAHDDRHPSLSIGVANGRVLVHCHAGCAQAAVLAALRAHGLGSTPSTRSTPTPPPAPAMGPRAHGTNGHRPGTARQQVQVFAICDAAGNPIAEHVRLDRGDGKSFFWRHPDGRPGLGELSPTELPLYGSERLSQWDPNKPVVLTEGEKPAAALLAIGIPALGTVTGASSTPGAESLSILRGRDVVLWPDADDIGRAHMHRIAQALQGVARLVRWIEWPDAPPGGDAFDYLAAGHGKADVEFLLLVADAVPAPEKDAESAQEGQGGTLDPLRSAPTASSVGTLPSIRSAPQIVRLVDTQPQPVRWLWPGRVPLAKMTLIDGDPGTGKSVLTLDLAARVTTGRPMPDGSVGDLRGPAGVVILSAEDDVADTIRPRLDVAGGDPARVVVLTAVEEITADAEGRERRRERGVTLADLEALRQAIAQVEARLVVIDPVMAYVGRTDAHVDAQVRGLLQPLAELAQELGVAIIAVRHLNKRAGSPALYRGGGSIAWIGAARSGLLVAPDPDDGAGDRRVLAVTKSNLGRPAPSLAYTIEAVRHETAGYVPRLVWLGESIHTARSLLAAPSDDADRSAVEEAREFLRDLLAHGPVPAGTVFQEARAAGIAGRTLKRAKALLGVLSRKQSVSGPWIWQLSEPAPEPKPAPDRTYAPKSANDRDLWPPSKGAKNAQGCQVKVVGTLGQVGTLRSICSTAESAAEGGADRCAVPGCGQLIDAFGPDGAGRCRPHALAVRSHLVDAALRLGLEPLEELEPGKDKEALPRE